MATASGATEGKRGSARLFVAYGVVVVLLGLVAFVVGFSGTGGRLAWLGWDAAPPPPAPAESARIVKSLKLPPRPAPVEKAPEKVPEKAEPVVAPAVAAPVQQTPPVVSSVPSQAESEKKPEPPKVECKVDISRWPTDKSDQAKAIQILLRDLGYYRGTTNGTLGPVTRTAIREFQLASGLEADAGEPTETLFEQLKKKCASN
jgi:hypothetical protein